jgi:hypothetical protein
MACGWTQQSRRPYEMSMAAAKLSSLGDARVLVLASMLGVALSVSAWAPSARAYAVGQPKVVFGQPKETSASEYTIPSAATRRAAPRAPAVLLGSFS